MAKSCVLVLQVTAQDLHAEMIAITGKRCHFKDQALEQRA
jgi:hypothetical protein